MSRRTAKKGSDGGLARQVGGAVLWVAALGALAGATHWGWGQLQRPEWAGNFTASLETARFSLNYRMQYMSEQGLRDVEIETIDQLYGPNGLADETYIHNLNATFNFNDQYRLYGGINNISDEKPFITEFAFPVNPIGRAFFLGFEMNLL